MHQTQERDPSERIDYAGIATLSLGLLFVLLALDQTTDWGLTDPRILAFFGRRRR